MHHVEQHGWHLPAIRPAAWGSSEEEPEDAEATAVHGSSAFLAAMAAQACPLAHAHSASAPAQTFASLASYVNDEEDDGQRSDQAAALMQTQPCAWHAGAQPAGCGWASFHAHSAVRLGSDGGNGRLHHHGSHDRRQHPQRADIAGSRLAAVSPAGAAATTAAGASSTIAPAAAAHVEEAGWEGWVSYRGGVAPDASPAPAAASGNAAAGGELYDPLAHVDATDGPEQQQPERGASPAPHTAPRGQSPAAGGPATSPAGTPLSGAHGGAAGHAPGGSPALTEVAAAPPVPALPPGACGGVELVVVWDLDETLILFNSLLSGAWARAAAAAPASAAASAAAHVAAVAAEAAGTPHTGSGDAPAAAVAASDSLSAAQLAARAESLGRRLADAVFDFVDDHMAFRELDMLDPLSFEDLLAAAGGGAPGDHVRAAPATAMTAPATACPPPAPHPHSAHPRPSRVALERIAALYSAGSAGGGGGKGAGRGGLAAVMDGGALAAVRALLDEVEALSGGWVEAARGLLQGVDAAVAAQAAGLAAAAAAGGQGQQGGVQCLAFRRVHHVLVSAGHLLATLGKLLLWGLDSHFALQDVYSASGRPKLDAFRALRHRFGPMAAYAAVGDGVEEERAAAVMGWGFVRVGFGHAPPPVPVGGGAWPRLGGGAGARPVGAIRPEDVLAAAREAY